MVAFFVKDNKLFTVLRLSRQAFGNYKLQIFVLTILGFVGGLLEGIGVNALVPLLSILLEENTYGNDIISQAIVKFFTFFNINFTVVSLLIFIICLFILKAVFSIVLDYTQIRITTEYAQKTRSDIFKKILYSDWPHLLKQKLGYLETILMIDVDYSTSLLSQLSSAILVVTGLLVYIFVAINISFSITIITLILGGILFLLFKPLVYKTRVVGYKRAQLNKELSHYVNQNIFGIKSVKTMVVNASIINKANAYFNELRNLGIKVAMYKTIPPTLFQPIGIIFISAVFAYSFYTSTISFAVLAPIIYLIHKMFTYIQQLQRGLQNVNNLVPHLKSVLDYESEAINNKEQHSGTARFSFNDQLTFKNVSFFYDSKIPVLKKINFILKKGEMIGLVGPSGVGKTTLVDIILRLFKPTEGTIFLDKQDISKIDIDEWRKNIGYVSQDIFLMNDTVANNISFYNETITESQMKDATQMANAYNFIKKLPQGFDTIIGERGVLLSAGQRQRIVLARILARKPALLILDEATSALDNESELRIKEVIKKLKRDITILVIAHRLTTVLDSDNLIILERGAIIEQGHPKELLKNNTSYFFKVYNLREK